MASTKNLLMSMGELVFAALIAVLDVSAQCSVFSRNYSGRPWPGDSIGVLAGKGVDEEEVVGAIALWQRGCSDLYAAGRIPSLLANRPGARTVRVDLDAKVSPRDGVCGEFNATSIKVWGFAIRAGKVRSCGPVTRLIAHELGHVLALGDAPETRECCTHIMSPIWPDKLLLDRVLPGECEVVAAANVPGLGLEPRTVELVAADLAVERDVSRELVASPPALTQSEERATIAQGSGERLARFLERRTAMRRGWSASRSVP